MLINEVKSGLEWFPFAEQAINTIYLLSENPDSLCEKLLQKAVTNAFDRVDSQFVEDSEMEIESDDKEPVDALALAQLCFLIGHVAIKQTVHLEQIESEWKRRRAAGNSQLSIVSHYLSSS